MAYQVQEWHPGDIITAEKLNHIEEGIVSSEFLDIEIVETEVQATWQEIYDAMNNNRLVRLYRNDGDSTARTFIEACFSLDGKYNIATKNSLYVANSPDQNPTPTLPQ